MTVGVTVRVLVGVAPNDSDALGVTVAELEPVADKDCETVAVDVMDDVVVLVLESDIETVLVGVMDGVDVAEGTVQSVFAIAGFWLQSIDMMTT